jgi:hypothetical protein
VVEDWTRWLGGSVAEKLPPLSVCCHNFNFNLGFVDSSILPSIFDFCLADGAQEIEGGGRTDPTSIRQFVDSSLILRFFDFCLGVQVKGKNSLSVNQS